MGAIRAEIPNLVRTVHSLAGKYLTFSLADEDYGIEILKVREIIGVMEITSVPHTPIFVKGVINLRGRVIPIIDLRLKFEMESREYDDRTCIVVVDVHNGSLLVGMVVDAVSEVIAVVDKEIEPPPTFGVRLGDAGSILGMAKMASGVKILIDVDTIVGVGVALEFQDI
ncbi:MAG: chemotaxis protein CheW [Proteobacteria bacterium]|nr:chemotaxis protein CheW [Pseudomonadota bacterium]MBU1686183.1 chemotaxis protein CheW [Pseudomonadota bacterium]